MYTIKGFLIRKLNRLLHNDFCEWMNGDSHLLHNAVVAFSILMVNAWCHCCPPVKRRREIYSLGTVKRSTDFKHQKSIIRTKETRHLEGLEEPMAKKTSKLDTLRASALPTQPFDSCTAFGKKVIIFYCFGKRTPGQLTGLLVLVNVLSPCACLLETVTLLRCLVLDILACIFLLSNL